MTNVRYTRLRIAAMRAVLLVLPLALLTLTGCPPRTEQKVEESPPPPLRSLSENIAAVNSNIAGITQSLASSDIDISARIHDEGKQKSYELNGTLRYLPPRFFYLNLSHVGVSDAMRIGSNDEIFWVWVKPEVEKLWWGRWADLDPAETYRMPLPPDMILAAMGLAPLPGADSGLQGPMPKVDDNRYYKLLYTAFGEDGTPWIQREYWLDRYPPFLPRVVIFNQPDGQVQMRATLDKYEPVGNSRVYVARDVRMVWPETDDSLRMRIGRLSFKENITADSAAYRLPKRVPIDRDRWVRVTSEGEGDESVDAAAPASVPAATQNLPSAAAARAGEPVVIDSATATAPASQPVEPTQEDVSVPPASAAEDAVATQPAGDNAATAEPSLAAQPAAPATEPQQTSAE